MRLGAGVRSARSLCLASLAALIVAVVGRGAALAHAELARSDPATDAVIESAPPRVTLWFTEEPELRFSEIQVLDRNRRQVDRRDLRADPADRLALSVGLSEQSPGTYTVLWKALSSVDGHVTRGAFAFTVGLDQVPTGLAVEAVAPSSTATPDRVIERTATYVGLAPLLGFFPFMLWILLPTLAAARSPRRDLLLSRGAKLAAFGLVLALLAALFGLVGQAAKAYDISLLEAAGGPAFSIAVGTRFGFFWWLRVLLLAALGALLLLAPWRSRPERWLGLGLVLGLALLLASALGGHAAASTEAAAAAVVVDWVHLAAVVAWIGGLSHLLLALWSLLRGREADVANTMAARLTPRFSVLGVVCVAALVLTGIYQAWLQVGSPRALFETAYGQALLVKLALIVPLLAAGAFNLLILRPRLEEAARGHSSQAMMVRRLRTSVLTEVAFALLVLGVVGVMTNLQPARTAVLALGIEETAREEDVRANIRIQPGTAGPNRFDVLLTDSRGQPITDAEKVSLRFSMLTMNMGESELVAYPAGNGHYVAQGGPLVMEGPWHIEAVVRRPGRLDVRPSIDVPIAASSPTGAPAVVAPPEQGAVLLGIELLAVGAAALAFALWIAPRRRPLLRAAVPLGVGAIIGGSFVAGSGAAAMNAAVRNPVPPTQESVQRGAEIYADRCAICHGDTGRGDGPAGAALRPPPADFRVHLAAGHTDAQLFDWITNGFPGTAMPPFRDQLSPEDRWHVINYIKLSFSPGSPQSRVASSESRAP